MHFDPFFDLRKGYKQLQILAVAGPRKKITHLFSLKIHFFPFVLHPPFKKSAILFKKKGAIFLRRRCHTVISGVLKKLRLPLFSQKTTKVALSMNI
jgi:hypothetical protein